MTGPAAPMELIEAGAGRLGELVAGALPDGWLRSLLVDWRYRRCRQRCCFPATDFDPVHIHSGVGGFRLYGARGIFDG